MMLTEAFCKSVGFGGGFSVFAGFGFISGFVADVVTTVFLASGRTAFTWANKCVARKTVGIKRKNFVFIVLSFKN
jgi:hypothetical protein